MNCSKNDDKPRKIGAYETIKYASKKYILEKQKECNHIFVRVGNDNNNIFVKCVKCGLTNSLLGFVNDFSFSKKYQDLSNLTMDVYSANFKIDIDLGLDYNSYVNLYNKAKEYEPNSTKTQTIILMENINKYSNIRRSRL